MIRIFPDFSVQVTSSGGGAGAAAVASGGMGPGAPAGGRVTGPGSSNGTGSVQGLSAYQR